MPRDHHVDVPDRERADHLTGQPSAWPARDGQPLRVGFPIGFAEMALPELINRCAPGQGIEFGRGGYAPLGGAGAPPRRFARHLPIERDGGTHFLAVEQVVAVHANAHYTTIFDGNDQLFCPLAIGDDDQHERLHHRGIGGGIPCRGHRFRGRAGDPLVEVKLELVMAAGGEKRFRP